MYQNFNNIVNPVQEFSRMQQAQMRTNNNLGNFFIFIIGLLIGGVMVYYYITVFRPIRVEDVRF